MVHTELNLLPIIMITVTNLFSAILCHNQVLLAFYSSLKNVRKTVPASRIVQHLTGLTKSGEVIEMFERTLHSLFFA